MVWGGFAYGGKLDLQFINGRINAEGYRNMLEGLELLENGSIIAGEPFYFQQDNAPIHKVNMLYQM